MPSLKLSLLGQPRIYIDDSLININRQKAVAILAYLAVTGEAQQRDTLAALFWPDSSQSSARASLRRDLSILNKALSGQWLIIERERIDLHRNGFWLDTHEFRMHLAECLGLAQGRDDGILDADCARALTGAADLYRGDFLSGFSLTGCPDFDDWQFFQAEEFRQELSSVLERLIIGYSREEAYELALPYTRRWVALDPLHEPAQQQLIFLYGRTNQKAAALRQYQILVQTLADELGIEPSPETTELFQQIRTSDSSKRAVDQGGEKSFAYSFLPPNIAAPRHNIPTPATPFVGREEELAAIAVDINEPTCHLLTLTGPGGIGKTRLAIEVAQRMVTDSASATLFPHGMYFVRLVSAATTHHLISAIAAAINYSFYRKVEPQEQLLNYIREKELLLVLDNFEHLLSPSQKEDFDGATLVANLLKAAPKVKLLVTSREELNLQDEWVHQVTGMHYPQVDDSQSAGQPIEAEEFSALQLFAQSARRVRPDFSMTDEIDCVLQICRLVEGMPLSIELAAGWLKVLPCNQIAHEIAGSLDLLTTSKRDVPARHRSIRAVFENSWQLLPDTEREVLRRLSILKGSFRQKTAKKVARASLRELAALVEKSMVRPTGTGRYRMHALLRQFAAEKLEADPQDKTETQKRHRDYFISYLIKREPALKSNQQKKALEKIGQEIANIRFAWETAVANSNIQLIEDAFDPLYDFFWRSSRYQEGVEILRHTAAQPQAAALPEKIKVKLIARQGAFYAALGVYGLARELLQKSLSMARGLHSRGETAYSLNVLGNVLDVQGESASAIQLYQESLDIFREIGNQSGTAESLLNLGWTVVEQGEYRKAKGFFQEGLLRYKSIGYQKGVANALSGLGMTAFFLGEYADSEEYFQESIKTFSGLNDRQGVARSLSGLGLVA